MILIEPYKNNDFPELVSFLKNNWAQNHVLYNKDLFDWQYRIRETQASFLMREGNSIIAFLGNIPGIYYVNPVRELARSIIPRIRIGRINPVASYRVFSNGVKRSRVAGVGLTMWAVDKKYQQSGLGVMLIRETEKKYPVMLTLGSSREVVSLYQKMGFSYESSLKRYVLPLDTDGYLALLPEQVDRNIILRWQKNIFDNIAKSAVERIPYPAILESFFIKSIEGKIAFSLLRDADFWQWRYIKSPGFKYIFFGDHEKEGVIVARVEKIIDEKLNGLCVCRIIELIPASPEVWDGLVDDNFVKLLQGVLRWAREQGCVACDFQCSSARLEPVLFKVGFRKQGEGYSPSECALAGRFQPLQFRAKPINFLWKIMDKGMPVAIKSDDTYFVKSDCDMDRPSIVSVKTTQ